MEILLYPDPRLRVPGEDVKKITNEFIARTAEMFRLMYDVRGLGLAATQVGWPVRAFVLNLAAEPPNERNGGQETICINPRIVSESGRCNEEEGCLSFPGVRGKIVRSEKVKIEYYDEKGRLMTIEESGLPAIAIQHEIDHINGRLFISRMTPASKLKVASKLKELEAQFAGEV